jgi:hypothetical protein
VSRIYPKSVRQLTQSTTYWIVDRLPNRDYQTVINLQDGKISPLAFPDISIEVRAFLKLIGLHDSLLVGVGGGASLGVGDGNGGNSNGIGHVWEFLILLLKPIS